MSTEYSNSSGRRSSRQGGRRPSSRNNQGSRPDRQESSPAKPKKLTLWQKVSAFFGGGEPLKPASTRSSSSRSPARSSAPAGPAEASEPRRSAKPERPSGFRTPEIIEVTSPRIYVGNLSFDATETDLSELFAGVGTVDSVEVVANKHTQRSKGFAFVQMQSVDEAKRAVTELHDKDYMGRKLVVSGAKAQEERRSDRARQPEQ